MGQTSCSCGSESVIRDRGSRYNFSISSMGPLVFCRTRTLYFCILYLGPSASRHPDQKKPARMECNRPIPHKLHPCMPYALTMGTRISVRPIDAKEVHGFRGASVHRCIGAWMDDPFNMLACACLRVCVCMFVRLRAHVLRAHGRRRCVRLRGCARMSVRVRKSRRARACIQVDQF